MSENNFHADLEKSKNGVHFVKDHFVQITGLRIPDNAVNITLGETEGENTGADCFAKWQVITSGRCEIFDNGQYRQINSPSITKVCQALVEIKADCGKFLNRNSSYQDYKPVLNADCGSLGFEVYTQGSHKPGWTWQYKEGLKLDGTGRRCAEPTYIVFSLYLSEKGDGLPYACVSIPWTTEVTDWLDRYINRNKQWRIEENVEAGTVTIDPPCGSDRGTGLAMQGSSKNEGFTMVHISMKNIVEDMKARIVMVGHTLSDKELFSTELFKKCAKYQDYDTAEKLARSRYSFLQKHAAEIIIV